MRYKNTLIALITAFVVMLTGCVYQNNNSPIPPTGKLKLSIKVKKSAAENPEWALKSFNYVKIWVYNDKTDLNNAKSFLVTKLGIGDPKFDGEFNFLKKEFAGKNISGFKIKTSDNGKYFNLPAETGTQDLVLDDIPVDAKWLIIAIPGEDGVDQRFINIKGKIKKGETTTLEMKENAADSTDTSVVLVKREEKGLTVRAIAQFFGKETIGQVNITGPFNGWNNNDAAFQMNDDNGDGVFEFTFKGKSPGKFEYKFGYGGGSWGDCDVTSDIQVNDNNGGQNSQAVIIGSAKSNYIPVITINSAKRPKNAPAVAINNAAGWDTNGGLLKIEVATDKYIMNNKLTLVKKLLEKTAGSEDNKTTVWEANNPAIKSVIVSYLGKGDTAGTAVKTTDFAGVTGVELSNTNPQAQGKYVVKIEETAPVGQNRSDVCKPGSILDNAQYSLKESYYVLENVKIPSTIGKYWFKVTAVDKYNVSAEENVVMEVVDIVPQFNGDSKYKLIKMGTTVGTNKVDVKTFVGVKVKVKDGDGIADIKSVKADLTAWDLGIVDLKDDGLIAVTGDAKAANGTFTNVFTLPNFAAGIYNIPLTITDKSDVMNQATLKIEIKGTEEVVEDNAVNRAFYAKKFGAEGIPTKLIIFDGRNAPGCTSDMSIEIMGGLNGWAGGEAWRMTQVSDKVWAKLVRLDEGTYEYKFRKFGDWGSNWNAEGVKDGPNNTIVFSSNDANPAKLFVFDGRNAAGCTSDMSIELMGGLNGWAGGADWKMTQVSDKVWVYLAHLEEGSYEYKYRKFGDWGSNWNEQGVKDGANNSVTVTGADANPAELFIFDGRNAAGCTADMPIELMGGLNGWAGGDAWKMSPVSDKVWMLLAHLEEGSYEYKYRKFGDWGSNWNEQGVKDGANNVRVVKPLTGN